jgi:hypothetical protein
LVRVQSCLPTFQNLSKSEKGILGYDTANYHYVGLGATLVEVLLRLY